MLGRLSVIKMTYLFVVYDLNLNIINPNVKLAL